MNVSSKTYVVEAVFVVASDSEEDAVEMIENSLIGSNENPSILDGMVCSGSRSTSSDANFMTSKQRRIFFEAH